MADFTPAPRLIQNVYFKIGTALHAREIMDCRLVPPAPVTITGGTPDAMYGEQPDVGWVLEITAIQDYETEDSLVNFLLDHAGETVEVIASPRRAGTAYFQTQVIVAAPLIGGKVGKHGESPISMPCLTKPTRTTAPVEGESS